MFQEPREILVEQRTRPPPPDRCDDLGAGHSELVHDEPRDEGRAVEAHAAVRENAVAGLDCGLPDCRTLFAFGLDYYSTCYSRSAHG